MGLFDAFSSAVHDANDAAHAARLKLDTDRTLAMVRGMPPAVGGEALHLFLNLRANTRTQWDRWSLDGKVKAAKSLQDEARKHRDFDLGKACGFFLASAWLESSVRRSAAAAEVFDSLERLAADLERNVPVTESLGGGSRQAIADGSQGSGLQDLIHLSMLSFLMAACDGFSRSKDSESLLMTLERRREVGSIALVPSGETRELAFIVLYGITKTLVAEVPENKRTFGDDEFGRRVLRVSTLANASSELSLAFGFSDCDAEEVIKRIQRDDHTGKSRFSWVMQQTEWTTREFARTKNVGVFCRPGRIRIRLATLIGAQRDLATPRRSMARE